MGGIMMMQFAYTPVAAPSGFIGSTASLGTPTLSNVSVVANTVTQFGSSVNCYSFAGTSSSYASYPGQSGFAVGTGDYTIEWFQYETDTSSFPRIFWYGTAPSMGVSIENGTFYIWPTPTSLKTGLNQKSTWRHFAIVRISGKTYLYYNGAVQNAGGTTDTRNITDTTSNFVIGAKIGGLASEQYGGLITSFRICKGIGIYTGNFTVPTSRLGQTQGANPYGGVNTSAISAGQCVLLMNP